MKLSMVNNQPVWVDEHGPFPSKVVVCPTCEGSGKVLADGMRGHAYTWDEMEDLGEDFIDDYFAGRYDVPCDECHGLRVTAEPITEGLSERDQARLEAHYEELQHEWEMRREMEAERRMGA